MELLRVSTTSNPNAVAGAMAHVLRQAPALAVLVVGAGALNQAVKAVAIARLHLRPDGWEPVCVPEFQDLTIDGQVRTAIRLVVERRPQVVPAGPADGAAGGGPDGDGVPAAAAGTAPAS